MCVCVIVRPTTTTTENKNEKKTWRMKLLHLASCCWLVWLASKQDWWLWPSSLLPTTRTHTLNVQLPPLSLPPLMPHTLSYKCVFCQVWLELRERELAPTSAVRKNAFDLIFTKCQLDVTSPTSTATLSPPLLCRLPTAWFIVLMKLRVNNLVAGWRPHTPSTRSTKQKISTHILTFLLESFMLPFKLPSCALSLWTFQRLDLRLNITIFHRPEVCCLHSYTHWQTCNCKTDTKRSWKLPDLSM